MSWTYSDVDRSADPAEALAWMDEVSSWPAVRAYKQRTLVLLASSGRVLDVGCGLGDEVRALGDRAVGLDPSSSMVAAARARGGMFVRGGVHALAFGSGSLDGARTDRVLQHVEDPERALDELVRVLRPGGLVVLAEPDQSTLRIDGTDPELTPMVVRFRADVGLRNGRLAGRLAGLLAVRGLRDVNHESFPIPITDPADAFGLPSWPSMLVERGWFTVEQAARFERSLERATADGSFCYCCDVVVTWGRTR